PFGSARVAETGGAGLLALRVLAHASDHTQETVPMIDLSSESPSSLAAAARLIPPARRGKRTHLWRPRHPRDCPDCGRPRYWSHSRLSVGCPGCRRRVRCEQVDTMKKTPEQVPPEASDENRPSN